MGQLPAEARHDVAVLFVHLTGEAVQHLLHGGVAGAGVGADGHGAPCVGIDAVVVRVHDDVKAPDLVGAGARLRNDHAVFLNRVLRQGVAVPADDQVHPPRRVQLARQMLILLKADVGQQHGKIDVDAVVGVADLAHLGGSGGGVHKGPHQRFGLGLVDDVLRDDADEQDVHAVHPQDLVGGEQPCGGVLDIEVGVDDGEPGTFFDEQQVCDAVIHLVVADGDDVRGKGVHDLDGGKPLVFGINDRAPEHITCNGVDGVGLFCPHFFNVAGQHGDAAHQFFVHLLCQKVSVQIIGVEDGDLFGLFHGAFLPVLGCAPVSPWPLAVQSRQC